MPGRRKNHRRFHGGEPERRLTARAHFAPVIAPSEAGDLPGAIARVVSLAKQYDQGAIANAIRA